MRRLDWLDALRTGTALGTGHPAQASTVTSSRQGLLFLAVMFAGTVIYRCQHGSIGRGPALLSLALVACSPAGDRGASTVLAVVGTFLLAYVLRQREIPAVLTWLGRVSYSLYPLHVVVLFLLPPVVPSLGTQPWPTRALTGLAYLITVLALAGLSYRMVEQPGQALGRLLIRKIDFTLPGRPLATTQRALPGTRRGENRRESV